MAPFGVLLRQYRERAGLGVHELGRAAGVHYSYVSKLEAARRPPPLRPVVRRLADALLLVGWERLELFRAAGLWPDVAFGVVWGPVRWAEPPAPVARSQAAERGTPDSPAAWAAVVRRLAAGEE